MTALDLAYLARMGAEHAESLAHPVAGVHLGAESSTLRAARVGEADQVSALVPVIETLTGLGVPTSVEAYSPGWWPIACGPGPRGQPDRGHRPGADLRTGRRPRRGGRAVLRPGGQRPPGEGGHPRRGSDPRAGGVLRGQDRARPCDRCHESDHRPGPGFLLRQPDRPAGARARHQAEVLLHSFGLRVLGVPTCQAMPHAFDLFEEQFRTAERFFAVLGALGRVNMYRTHEVARVRATLRARDALGSTR